MASPGSLPSEAQLSALMRFAVANWPNWKQALREAWEAGGPGDPVLAQLRVSHGRTWLWNFKLPEDRAPYRCSRCGPIFVTEPRAERHAGDPAHRVTRTSAPLVQEVPHAT